MGSLAAQNVPQSRRIPSAAPTAGGGYGGSSEGINAKTIDYRQVGSGSAGYGVTDANALGKLNRLWGERGQKAGGSKSIFDAIVAYGNRANAPPDQRAAIARWAKTGDTTNFTPAWGNLALDYGLREVGRQQQTKGSFLGDVGGFLKRIAPAVAGSLLVGPAGFSLTSAGWGGAAGGALAGGINDGWKGAALGGLQGYGIGSGVGGGFGSAGGSGSAGGFGSAVRTVATNVLADSILQGGNPAITRFNTRGIPGIHPSSAYAAAYPGPPSVANSAARPINMPGRNTAPYAAPKPYVAPRRVQIAPNMPIINYDPSRNYQSPTTMQQALMRPAATRASASNATAA